ncbi:hypothetical protein [Nonomuraea sp. NPDC049784]
MTATPSITGPHVMHDDKHSAHQADHITAPTSVLIRPDGCIADLRS